MIPLHDDNPTTLTPIVTVGLIAACVAVFLWQVSLPPAAMEAALYSYGMIPAVLFGERELPPALAAVPAELSVVTSMFLHGGWMHLIGNMLYLWIFGNNVEDAMGHLRFLVFYLLCGLAAAFAQAFRCDRMAAWYAVSEKCRLRIRCAIGRLSLVSCDARRTGDFAGA